VTIYSRLCSVPPSVELTNGLPHHSPSSDSVYGSRIELFVFVVFFLAIYLAQVCGSSVSASDISSALSMKAGLSLSMLISSG